MDKIIATIILAIYVILMIFGAVVTIPKTFEKVASYDKVLHFLEFLILSMIVLNMLISFKLEFPYVLAVLFCLLLTFVTEAVQRMTTTRSFSVLDMVADAIGIIAGMSIYHFLIKHHIFK